MRQLKYFQAINEATDLCLAKDENVYLIGLGVPDPKGIFGTTSGLQAKYGSKRVMDMPVSEDGMTGVAIGSALVGKRPIMTHQRLDFVLLSLEQLVNQAAKWHYMFGGHAKIPMVVRLIVGRGWGQGPQHSQSLHSWFAHIPGLVVVMPSNPYDAKGLLISAVENDNPVIYVEHRWLHGLSDDVPEGLYRTPIGKGRVVREGTDITIVASSYSTIDALRAHALLCKTGISAEILDLRTIRPLDEELILDSVKKTGRMLVVDMGWKSCGLSAEVISLVVENCFSYLKCAPQRITLPEVPTPTSPALAKYYYPGPLSIVNAVTTMVSGDDDSVVLYSEEELVTPDVPDATFKGPF